jgi:hypothetical protein
MWVLCQDWPSVCCSSLGLGPLSLLPLIKQHTALSRQPRDTGARAKHELGDDKGPNRATHGGMHAERSHGQRWLGHSGAHEAAMGPMRGIEHESGDAAQPAAPCPPALAAGRAGRPAELCRQRRSRAGMHSHAPSRTQMLAARRGEWAWRLGAWACSSSVIIISSIACLQHAFRPASFRSRAERHKEGPALGLCCMLAPCCAALCSSSSDRRVLLRCRAGLSVQRHGRPSAILYYTSLQRRLPYRAPWTDPFSRNPAAAVAARPQAVEGQTLPIATLPSRATPPRPRSVAADAAGKRGMQGYNVLQTRRRPPRTHPPTCSRRFASRADLRMPCRGESDTSSSSACQITPRLICTKSRSMLEL